MNETDSSTPRYGRERICPHCGARVAQRATTCFFCDSSLDGAPRPNRLSRTLPWADLALFAVIGGLIVLWWMRPPESPARPSAVHAAPAITSTPTRTATPTLQDPAAAMAPPAAPEASPTAEATPTALPTPILHRVARGESLLIIANKYGSKVNDIIAANSLSASGFIREGQELTVPITDPNALPTPTVTPTPTGGTLIYRVASGDTIAGIAKRFGSSSGWILEANSLSDSDILSIGQSLLIPLSLATPEPTATPTPLPALPTFTPSPRFRAPSLLVPADAAQVSHHGRTVLLWTSVGFLAEDEWYVVTLNGPDGGQVLPPHWTKSTSWLLPQGCGSPREEAFELTWGVQVYRGEPSRSGDPVSPAGATRRFICR